MWNNPQYNDWELNCIPNTSPNQQPPGPHFSASSDDTQKQRPLQQGQAHGIGLEGYIHLLLHGPNTFGTTEPRNVYVSALLGEGEG